MPRFPLDVLRRRAPHGARGLKPKEETWMVNNGSRAPHGARGLKREGEWIWTDGRCRAPHGARGLKHALVAFVVTDYMSRPARGAWIETI